MTTKQDILDYFSNQITKLNASISEQEDFKSQYDAAISQQNTNISYFNDQKTAADTIIDNLTTQKDQITNEFITFINNLE